MNPDSKSSLTVAGEATSTCWSCGTMRAEHFCSACGKVQPPTPVDYFTFFGLPRKLNLDGRLLECEFYALSRKLHPDLFARADRREQNWSLEQSSQLNDAYRTLKDPIKRTQYLLQLEGVKLDEQSSAASEKARQSGEAKKQVVPPDLLEEVFELNLQLQELRMSKRMGENDPALIQELQRHRADFESRLVALSDKLQGLWKEWDKLVDIGTEEDRASVRDEMVDLLNRRNYIRNLVREVNGALEP